MQSFLTMPSAGGLKMVSFAGNCTGETPATRRRGKYTAVSAPTKASVQKLIHTCGEFRPGVINYLTFYRNQPRITPSGITTNREGEDRARMNKKTTNTLTPKRKKENAPAGDEQFSLSILEQVAETVVVVDRKGTVVRASKTARELCGKNPLQQPFESLFTLSVNPSGDEPPGSGEASGFGPYFARALRGEPVRGMEMTVELADGRVRTMVFNATPLKGNGTRASGCIISLEDVTERKLLEEEHLKTQKLESIGILAGGIAHDFNNLLTGIIGNIGLAKARIGDPANAKSLLDKAEAACARAAELTQRLITFAKGSVPAMRTVYINELLTDSVQFWLSGSNVVCRFDLADDLRPVNIDEGQVRQVVQNIVVNAREAMPGGGRIEVTARNARVSAKAGLPVEDGHYVRVTFKDTGPGIDRTTLLRIFDPYYSTKERGMQRGMGLGLSVCHSIIKKHGGHIMAESRPGSGAVFSFYLPASDGKPEKKRAPKILVMDDEELILDLAEAILDKIGFRFAGARSGEEAIELYKEARNAGESFDAVVLDLTVPGGMGGLPALRALLSIDPEIKAVVSSGYLDDVVLTNSRRYGFIAAIPKPYKPDDLIKVITDVVGRGAVFH
ncbi:MAG: response regulator [Spirochaetes bacterium]|nr:MAG: response regulator [Spirochaetota bacterium]